MVAAICLIIAMALALALAALHPRLTTRQRIIGTAVVIALGSISLLSASAVIAGKLASRMILPVGWLWLAGLGSALALLRRQRARAAAAAMGAWVST